MYKYAVAAANYDIAERIIQGVGQGFSGFRTIPVRDLKKSQARKYASVISNPEEVYVQNENTNEWELV